MTVQRAGSTQHVAVEIDGMTREEAEVVAARLLLEMARRLPLNMPDSMHVHHVAARLEGFATRARGE